MRTRLWFTALVLAGLFAASQPAAVQAAIWPFSAFSSNSAKKKPAHKPKSKKNAKGYGARTKAQKATPH
jgi:hypothetical protein